MEHIKNERKIPISTRKCRFRPKNTDLNQKYRFEPKIPILTQNIDFDPKTPTQYYRFRFKNIDFDAK